MRAHSNDQFVGANKFYLLAWIADCDHLRADTDELPQQGTIAAETHIALAACHCHQEKQC